MAETLVEPVVHTSTAEPQPIAPEVQMQLKQIEEASRELLGRVVNIANIPPIEGLDKSLDKRVAEYTARRTVLIESARELFKPLLTSIEQAYRGEGEIGIVNGAANECRAEKGELLEQAHKLCLDGEQLAKDIVDQQKPIAEKFEREREETLETIKADLTKIGQGLEATQAGVMGVYGKAANDQFTFFAKQNVRYRAAHQKAEEAKNRVTQHTALTHACLKRANQLRKEITNAAIAGVRV